MYMYIDMSKCRCKSGSFIHALNGQEKINIDKAILICVNYNQ